jgi:hypothetical protein
MEAEFSPPEDVLADILGRLPHRDLAQSRRVCSSWPPIVDTRRLLLRHALPLSVHGLFLNYRDYAGHHFFARPTSTGPPRIDGRHTSLAAGTVAGLKKEPDYSLYQWCQSAYWKQTLYLHCRGCYIMRYTH